MRDLLVAGSLAMGDHVPGVSDIDLVAVTEGAVDGNRVTELAELHRETDRTTRNGPGLGAVYVDEELLSEPLPRHLTWTHGRLVRRSLSDVTRAELLRRGFAVFGRPPSELLPEMTSADIRAAARAELRGYWTWASRRPWLWLDPALADLALTSMARARHTMETGELLTKTEAISRIRASEQRIAEILARRRGDPIGSPRLRMAWIAWRDVRHTVEASCHSALGRD